MSRKRYADLDFGGKLVQAHYRTAGSGPPLVLLHPSPLSSAFMEPLIELLADQVTSFAPDTPGYGASDPLPDPPPDLAPYVDWLGRLLDAWGLDTAGLYGSATGAQIAIEFARRFPERAEYLVLENAVHFDAEERQRILARYFPDLAPREDGSHLQEAWRMSARLFQYFPWFDEDDRARVADSAPPTALVHATAMAYLQAGTDYPRAYRAAFENEDARRLQAVTRPTCVIRWEGSILRRHARRLDDFAWPDNIRMVHCGAGLEARYEALTNVIAERVADS